MMMLVGSALAVFVGAWAMIVNLDRSDLLTRLLIAVIATLALGALDSRYTWLQGRRYLLRWDPHEAAYFRSILTSLGLVVCAGTVLVSVSLLWP